MGCSSPLAAALSGRGRPSDEFTGSPISTSLHQLHWTGSVFCDRWWELVSGSVFFRGFRGNHPAEFRRGVHNLWLPTVVYDPSSHHGHVYGHVAQRLVRDGEQVALEHDEVAELAGLDCATYIFLER